MAVPSESRRRYPSLFQLTSGLEVLDKWSLTATQAEKNSTNRALFAVVEKTVFTEYAVVDDVEKTMEFFVFSGNDLIVKIHVHDLGSFGIVYVGPAAEAPGLDCPKPDLEASEGEPGLDRYSRRKKA
jgi:uncharacterized protein DUF6235